MATELNQSHCYHLYQEDLHDGVTKTKYTYYMVPINAKFVSYMARQDNTKLIKFNQNSWP